MTADSNDNIQIDNAVEYLSEDIQISYKASLVDKYYGQHGKIRDLYHDIVAAYQTCDDQLFVRLLEALQVELRTHLLDEALNMYVYLKHYYANDPRKLDIIQRFNRNIQKSSRQAFDLIRRFTENCELVPRDQEFLSELLEVCNRLEVQLSAEERHLFQLYQDADKSK